MESLKNLKIVSAGAGSGKTYRLTQEMVQFLEQGQVRPEGIIATTFTNKAASELQERVRLKLLEKNMSEKADKLTNALIGTVHGLGVKLLKRFAYEAGVSPDVSIVADEDQQILFNQSLATVLTEDRVLFMEQLTEYLGQSANEYFDWRKEVKRLIDVARSNDFSIADLEESKLYSFQSLQALLGEKDSKPISTLDEELTTCLQNTIKKLEQGEDKTKATQSAISLYKNSLREHQLKGFIPWPQWAKISKQKTGAKSKTTIAPLVELTADIDRHPSLHDQLKAFIHSLFDISIAALKEYDAYKKQRGLIDYIDMEVLIKELLQNKVVAEVLSVELDLLMVDEFQDTSPIQLEIFLRLSQLATYSIWVGDPKQSIYGFRGADPKLMQAIIKQMGGIKEEDIQKYSWRSREDIVYATNALFTKAFPDLPEEQVALVPKRRSQATEDSANTTDEPTNMGAALIHWHFKYQSPDGKKRKPAKPWFEQCIAQTLADWLKDPPLIIPKGATQARAAQAGDVAILCRSNQECIEMAEVLNQAGLQVSISRAGLLSTAEAQLILSCLKLILNRNDALSTAEILKLGENWSLEQIIEDRLTFIKNQDLPERSRNRWAEQETLIEKIAEIRRDALELSTTETLELTLEMLDLRRIIVSWGNSQKRLDNVDILIQLSNQYEENCNRLHAPASLGGFLLYLDQLERASLDKQGAGRGDNAVEVMTYHRSKGLEWPILICHSLEKSLRADVWGVDLISKSEEVDLNHILGNRYIRYWMNPFANQYRKTKLQERLLESEAQKIKTTHANEEEARLLYVGITRARDYLIFPSTNQPTKWLNRVWHAGKEDTPTLDPDSTESPWIWDKQILPINTHVFEYEKSFINKALPKQIITYFEAPAGSFLHPYQHINLKSRPLGLPLDVQTSAMIYGPKVELKAAENPYAAIKALKAFLTAYQKEYSISKLQEIADELVDKHQVGDLIDADTFLQQTQYWWAFLEKQFSIKQHYRKYPITYFYQEQQFNTIVDLLLETKSGMIAIQHSTFNGDSKQWKGKAMELSEWCFLTQNALKEIFKQDQIQTIVHFAFSGAMMKVATQLT